MSRPFLLHRLFFLYRWSFLRFIAASARIVVRSWPAQDNHAVIAEFHY
jgi:hypothetical protein